MDARSYTPWIAIGILIIMVALLACPAIAAAPFSFSVSPQNTEAAPGASIPYTITITAVPGFNDPVNFIMKVSAAGYTDAQNLGTYSGPYPRTFTYVLKVPTQVPAGVAVRGTVTGTSGPDQYSQSLDLRVTGSGGPVEDIIGTITSAINGILQALGLR